VLVVEVAPLYMAYVKTKLSPPTNIAEQTARSELPLVPRADQGWQETRARCVIALAF